MQQRFPLVQRREGTTICRSWPYPPFSSVPKYLKIGSNNAWQIVTESSSYLGWFLPFNFVSTSDHGLRRFCPCYHKICMRMRMHECFQCNNLLSESWSGSVLLKRLGHPMNWAKGLRLLRTNTWFKIKVRTKTSNPVLFFLKDSDERYTVDGNPWGKRERHTKIKEHAATSLIAPDSKHSIAWQHQSSQVKVAPRHPCW